VLDFDEASQRFQIRAPREQPNYGNGNKAMTGLDEALSYLAQSPCDPVFQRDNLHGSVAATWHNHPVAYRYLQR
jgi:hypothetical protein